MVINLSVPILMSAVDTFKYKFKDTLKSKKKAIQRKKFHRTELYTW